MQEVMKQIQEREEIRKNEKYDRIKGVEKIQEEHSDYLRVLEKAKQKKVKE